ncbi:MAG: DUF2130 domain-containing protein [Candidatus Delongbacteria bacterium]|jgi:hypothetical protein|nr:DUF2130 domain-containing protein [Candidatus Delongbacteria bacterium]
MSDKIKCPSCGHEFDVEKVLSSQIEDNIKAKYDELLNEELNKLKQEKEDLELRKENQDKLVKIELKKQLNMEKDKIEKGLQEEFDDKMKSLEKENKKRKEENRELKKKELEILEKENELKDREEDYELRLKEEMLNNKKEIEVNARTKERESFEVEKQGLLKQIEDNKKLAEEMKRKADQGSMQLQGESMELAIEKYLKESFPYDQIDEIKKGARGADCIQFVKDKLGQECGTIYYESKLTKEFQNTWLDKFKADMQGKKANIGVLVTDAMPKDMERAGQKNGIWICNYLEFKSLVIVLRESMIQISNAIATQENKGDKMSMLYDYLTGSEFRLHIEAIVEGFTSMKNDIDKEKRAMARLWKTRDAQIEKVLNNTIGMYGSIKGIGGNAIQTVNMLELDDSEITDTEDDEKIK